MIQGSYPSLYQVKKPLEQNNPEAKQEFQIIDETRKNWTHSPSIYHTGGRITQKYLLRRLRNMSVNCAVKRSRLEMT
jgi:hypothetical protein